jgi:hypothetical protein
MKNEKREMKNEKRAWARAARTARAVRSAFFIVHWCVFHFSWV